MVDARTEYFDIMKEVCKDNQQAFDFVAQAVDAALHFDHVQDSDPIDKDGAQRVLEALVLYWPLNPFIRAHAPFLVQAMSHGLELWRSHEDEYAIYNCIASATLFAIGGQPMVDSYMPKIRECTRNGKIQDDERDKEQDAKQS